MNNNIVLFKAKENNVIVQGRKKKKNIPYTIIPNQSYLKKMLCRSYCNRALFSPSFSVVI